MKKIFLPILFLLSLKSNFIQADVIITECEPSESKVTITRSMTPRDFVVTGVLAGGSFELANWARKDSRYKHVLQFGKRYPGFFVMGLSATIGTGLLYGQPIQSRIVDFLKNRQS